MNLNIKGNFGGSVMVSHRIPESRRALLRIVSLTAANTNRIFEVSVA